MKLKLAGLLLFSHAAKSIEIDSTNYKQHLCDDRIFMPVQSVTETMPPHLAEAMIGIVKGDHQHYCNVRSYYDEAVENKKTGTWRTHKTCGANKKDLIEPSRCMEKQGVYYAQACEKLKQDRDTMPNSWNAVVPKLVSCNNM